MRHKGWRENRELEVSGIFYYLDSHATWRWPLLLVTLPALLAALHQYSPESRSFLLCWARRKKRPLSGSKILKQGNVTILVFISSWGAGF